MFKIASPEITLLVPCYNEEENIEIFFKEIYRCLKRVDLSFEILCINDGSRDKTFECLKEQKKIHSEIKIINFSRNFGKEAALTAGLDFAKGKAVIPIDCDLQDPPKLISKLIEKWREGFDVVLAKRADRSEDSWCKRFTAEAFYKAHNAFADIKIPQNVGDFRLMDKKVVDELKKFPERQRFMKGIFAYAGFKTAIVEYKRERRAKGSTKFNYWKLWNYAIEGLTSFSTVMLKIWTYLGLFITSIAFFRGVWIFIKVIIYGIEVPGYASLMITIIFLGGLNLLSFGILGEYIGRIYMEVKKRPIYIVQDYIK